MASEGLNLYNKWTKGFPLNLHSVEYLWSVFLVYFLFVRMSKERFNFDLGIVGDFSKHHTKVLVFHFN